jgi:hypothetical protein
VQKTAVVRQATTADAPLARCRSETYMRAINLTFVAMSFLFPALAFPDDDEQTLRHIKTVLWPQAYRTQDVE